MLTFWKLSLFHFVLFFLPWKPFFDNQPCLLFFLLSFWLFTFCPLKRKPFGVCLEFWQCKFKRKPSWGNLYWYILILTQSFAGLMGWRDMSFCFSHFHLCVMRVPFRLFIWGILFFLNRILLNLEKKKCYFIECPTFRGMSVSKNVAKEVYYTICCSQICIPFPLFWLFGSRGSTYKLHVSSSVCAISELRKCASETVKYLSESARIELVASVGQESILQCRRLPAMQEILVQPRRREGPLEKEMATCCSILAWEIPRTEKPGRLLSMGS